MKQYQFGPWTFDTDSGILQGEDGAESLDPKIAALLLLFLQHPGRLFSRDELLDTVWKGTVVSDNSVSWAISRLRKALRDEAKSPQYLVTLPKKGYRFIAQVSAAELNSSTNVSFSSGGVTSAKTHAHRMLQVTAVVVTIILSITLLLLFSNPKKSVPGSIHNIRLFTIMDGVEKSAELSPDGLIIAFVHRVPGAQSFNIWLKPLRENRQFDETKMDGTVLPDQIDSSRDVSPWPLTQEHYSYEQILWGQDAYNLFAVRIDNSTDVQGQRCQIVQLKLDIARTSVLQQQEILSCFANSATRISYSRQTHKLYFTDKRQADNNMSLYEYDLTSDQSNRLLKADESGRGIHFIDYNPNNNTLLYLQDINWRSTRFATWSLSHNVAETLFTQEAIYYSAYWGIAADTIWLNWGNDNVLEYQLSTGDSEFILSSSYGWNFNLKPAGNNQVTFEVSDTNGADFTFFRDQQWHTFDTNFTESSTAYSPRTGKLAFVSNQNGLPQIWVKDSRHEVAKQLSNVTEFREIQYLSWSQDETKIIGISESVVGQLDLTQSGYQALLNNGVAPYWPKLSPENHKLLVSHHINNQWHLYLYPVQDKAVSQSDISPFLLTGGYIAEFLSENLLVFNRQEREGLFTLDLETRQEKILWPDLPAGSFWQIHNNTLFYRDGNMLKYVTLADLDPPNPVKASSKLLSFIPLGLSRSFDINPVTGELLFLDYRRTQSDIKLGTYQRAN